jgi:hypothetical protein
VMMLASSILSWWKYQLHEVCDQVEHLLSNVVDRNVGLWRIPVLQQQTQGKCMGFSRKELTERRKGHHHHLLVQKTQGQNSTANFQNLISVHLMWGKQKQYEFFSIQL